MYRRAVLCGGEGTLHIATVNEIVALGITWECDTIRLVVLEIIHQQAVDEDHIPLPV
jgi:hypothetical protein